MKIHKLKSSQWLNRPRDEVFAFFERPENLEKLTPSWLKFAMRTDAPVTMEGGARIDYRISLHGLPMRWQSEISWYNPPHGFVDRQIRGPYRAWEHVHLFLERDGGTQVLDEVSYALPIGGPVHRWLVAPDLRRIFAHRGAVLERLFDGQPAEQFLSIDGPPPDSAATLQTH